jgi:hypothetical protein
MPPDLDAVPSEKNAQKTYKALDQRQAAVWHAADAGERAAATIPDIGDIAAQVGRDGAASEHAPVRAREISHELRQAMPRRGRA